MSTYALLVRARFEAAHHLTAYRGAPEPVHGHSWTVEVHTETSSLGPEGYAVDFVELKGCLDELVSRFHHADINAVPPFDQRSPTTEHLAEWFFSEMASRLPGAGLSAVTVWEGPDCAATFRPE
jgi:6-pyruvoyltetrahydropterin/6-carboxytetrahydropterin synthase